MQEEVNAQDTFQGSFESGIQGTRRRRCNSCVELVLFPDQFPTPCNTFQSMKNVCCFTCVAKHVRVQLSSTPRGVFPIVTCPIVDCNHELDRESLKRLVGQALVAEYDRLVVVSDQFFCVECGESRRFSQSGVACDGCSGKVCYGCRGNHVRVCEPTWRDEETRNTLLRTCRRCPRCHVLVEKNGGCGHVYCRCGKSFDWYTV
jgi:hypothetical protein